MVPPAKAPSIGNLGRRSEHARRLDRVRVPGVLCFCFVAFVAVMWDLLLSVAFALVLVGFGGMMQLRQTAMGAVMGGFLLGVGYCVLFDSLAYKYGL